MNNPTDDAVGFAVYGSYPDQHIKSSQEEVYDQFIEFLNSKAA